MDEIDIEGTPEFEEVQEAYENTQDVWRRSLTMADHRTTSSTPDDEQRRCRCILDDGIHRRTLTNDTEFSYITDM